MHSLQQLSDYFNIFQTSNKVQGAPHTLYEPINYILGLGGKKIRPLLVLLGYDLYKDNLEDVMPAANAIEIFHNFTLVHDDIMDEAALRRGKDTIHVKYDIPTAILAGDAMQIIACQELMKCPTPYISKVMEVFLDTALKVCEGQQMDLDFEQMERVSMNDYIKMIGYKTSILLSCAIQIGAIIGEVGEEEVKSLGEYAYNLGLAFQLQDDYLDTFGDEKSFGKMIGGDIIQGKKTFLVLSALENSSKEEGKVFLNLLNDKNLNPDLKIQKVKERLINLGIPKIAQSEINYYIKKSLAELKKLNISEGKKEELSNLVDKILKRES